MESGRGAAGAGEAAEAPPPLSLRLAALLLRGVVAVLGATWRVEVVLGGAQVEDLAASRRPVVLAHWHNRLLTVVPALRGHLLARGYPIAVMASRSRDGALGALVARAWGARVVRGSASRGGSEGLRQLHRVLAREGSAVVVIPDGPRGPLYEAKPGALVLAQMARVPVVPVTASADRAWRLGSWDRLLLPRPFARVRVAFGEPFGVPREADSAGLEAARVRLETDLRTLTTELDALCGSRE